MSCIGRNGVVSKQWIELNHWNVLVCQSSFFIQEDALLTGCNDEHRIWEHCCQCGLTHTGF